MGDNLKRFFKKKKADLKFKRAGPGQRLGEDTPKPVAAAGLPKPLTRVEPSEEAKQAAAAALARFEDKPRNSSTGFVKPRLQTQMKSKLEKQLSQGIEELKLSSSESPAEIPNDDDTDTPSDLAANGVYFKCPLIGADILSKSEWRMKIREYLYDQLQEEKGLTACLIIRNCNQISEKVEMCIETLSKYVQNIISNPDEEKYRKIRLSNKVFQERVAGVEGATEFLEALGFSKELVSIDDKEEEFFVLPKEKIKDLTNLEVLLDGLKCAEIIPLELDRNLQVLLPSQAESRFQLPSDFFRLTPEELKREQQARREIAESSLMLRTKAMRERQERKELRKYRYALIRIRFPDGILLQGTFSVHEKFNEIVKFVSENLVTPMNFTLSTTLGYTFTDADHEQSLLNLQLVPATVLMFSSNVNLPGPSSNMQPSYLKPEVVILLRSL